jgi:hypothetical protein
MAAVELAWPKDARGPPTRATVEATERRGDRIGVRAGLASRLGGDTKSDLDAEAGLDADEP